jgi:uncharacterized protein YcbX
MVKISQRGPGVAIANNNLPESDIFYCQNTGRYGIDSRPEYDSSQRRFCPSYPALLALNRKSMDSIFLQRIEIFPVKSLDGLALTECGINPGGILENDRVYAIVDSEGKVVNGKRTARIHHLRCSFDPGIREIRLWQTGETTPVQFDLADTGPISQWLSAFFGFPVTLQYERQHGFPDDRTAFGPTVTSDASLRAVLSWFPSLTLESVRRRFRTNLELAGGEAFCEDRLYGAPGELKSFHVGEVHFDGHNPCQRCVVPTRDPESGDPVSEFQKKFMQLRKEHLPAWANVQRFNHFYRFAVNTSIPATEAGKKLRVGDVLRW